MSFVQRYIYWENYMKYKNVFIGSISALAGILLVILVLVNCILVQESFLNYTNQKYSVEKNLSMTESDLKDVVHAMVSYVKGKTDSPQIKVEIKGNEVDFFNKKEIGHLEDVRILIRNIYIAMLAMCIVSVAGVGYLVYKKDYSAMRKGVLFAWMLMLLVSVLVGILAIIDIDIVVTGFHQIFLSGSKWVLNPALDRSVWMFRTFMYKDVVLVLGGIVAGVAAITIVPVVLIGKRKNIA